MPVLELRTYRLEPGSATAFERLMREDALPLLGRAGIDVVRFSVSLVPDEHPAPDAILIRAFPDLGERARREEEFYGSAAWRSGPREPILACIRTFHTVVLDVPPRTVDGLRRGRES